MFVVEVLCDMSLVLLLTSRFYPWTPLIVVQGVCQDEGNSDTVLAGVADPIVILWSHYWGPLGVSVVVF